MVKYVAVDVGVTSPNAAIQAIITTYVGKFDESANEYSLAKNILSHFLRLLVKIGGLLLIASQ